MSTTATTSQGAAFKVKITGTYTLAAQNVSITGPAVNQEYDDITNLDSTGGFKEWLPVMRDGGNVSGEFIWNPLNSAQAALKSANALGTRLDCQVVWPFAAPVTDQFFGYVSKWEQKAEQGKAMRVSWEVKVDGAITTS